MDLSRVSNCWHVCCICAFCALLRFGLQSLLCIRSLWCLNIGSCWNSLLRSGGTLGGGKPIRTARRHCETREKTCETRESRALRRALLPAEAFSWKNFPSASLLAMQLSRVCQPPNVQHIPHTHKRTSFGYWAIRKNSTIPTDNQAETYTGYPIFEKKDFSTTSNQTKNSQNIQRCMEKLQNFTPTLCIAHNVTVSGTQRDIQPWDADDARTSSTLATYDNLLLATNLMGMAFYHTMYESLASVAFALDELWTPEYTLPTSIHVLDNLCATPVSKVKLKNCSSGNPPILAQNLWRMMGVSPNRLVNYASSFRGVKSPESVRAKTLIYDCSNGNPRGYWHVMKLRQILRRRFKPVAVERKRHILMISRGRACSTCSLEHVTAGRDVVNEQEIEKVLKSYGDVVVFQGHSLPLESQLRLFQDAKLVIGPHGAAESLLIFCERGTPVIEYVRGDTFNSGLYVGYAHMFNLPYWAVVSRPWRRSHGYDIDPENVAATVSAALGIKRHPGELSLVSGGSLYQVHGCQVSLECVEGCCHYPCCRPGLSLRGATETKRRNLSRVFSPESSPD